MEDKYKALIFIVLVLGGLYAAKELGYFGSTVPTTEVQYSSFKYSAVKEDASGTAVTSATTRVWFDEDNDGFMDYSEIGTFTESSGVYSSDEEYPINYIDEDGNPVEFDLWVQCYASGYQVTYKLFHITGQRNSDGSAKSVGQMELRAVDDSVTYDGEIGGVTWDDSTDYNATLSGTSGLAEVDIVLSAADKGLSSQIWEGVSYQDVYGVHKDHDYYVKWDEIPSSGEISKNSILAPDFFCIYMTVGDKNDLSPSTADFDINFSDGTNWYFISIVDDSWGDLMYNTADASAPRPTVSFDVGTISASGTTAATYGVAIWQGVTYEQMLDGTWTKSATYYLGTPGDDWDWTVV